MSVRIDRSEQLANATSDLGSQIESIRETMQKKIEAISQQRINLVSLIITIGAPILLGLALTFTTWLEAFASVVGGMVMMVTYLVLFHYTIYRVTRHIVSLVVYLHSWARATIAIVVTVLLVATTGAMWQWVVTATLSYLVADRLCGWVAAQEEVMILEIDESQFKDLS